MFQHVPDELADDVLERIGVLLCEVQERYHVSDEVLKLVVRTHLNQRDKPPRRLVLSDAHARRRLEEVEEAHSFEIVARGRFKGVAGRRRVESERGSHGEDDWVEGDPALVRSDAKRFWILEIEASQEGVDVAEESAVREMQMHTWVKTRLFIKFLRDSYGK